MLPVLGEWQIGKTGVLTRNGPGCLTVPGQIYDREGFAHTLPVMVFQALKPIARGSNQRRACRDEMNRNALHHIFEATLLGYRIGYVLIIQNFRQYLFCWQIPRKTEMRPLVEHGHLLNTRPPRCIHALAH
jgi:hypothetical protein